MNFKRDRHVYEGGSRLQTSWNRDMFAREACTHPLAATMNIPE